MNGSYKISPRGDGDGGLGASRQAARLVAEQVPVVQNEMGEYVVKTVMEGGASTLWSAIVLPSEVQDGGVAHEDS